ncbi:MAG: hypothetical protein HYZ29_28005 [Myxococcales bacterium]|nr:hypothetical protein [Myxococcales bacterium]
MHRWVISLVALCALGCGSEDSSGSGAAGGSGGNGASGGSGATGGSAGSGGGATGGSGGSATGGSGGTADCLAQVSGVEVADVDLDGFPSYSVDGCQLAYVSGKTGQLLLRDLATGKETVIDDGAEGPRRPSLAGSVLAWESAKHLVRVRHGGTVTILSGGFNLAGEPRATSDAVVFTGWLGTDTDTDSDVFLYQVGTGTSTAVAAGPGQQRFADVSATHVAVSDFSEDPGGVYTGDGASQADIIVFDRATLTPTVRAAPGKQAFPMLGSSGTLSYLEWITVHPIPKLQDYTLRAVPLATPTATATKIADVQSDQAVRPTARAGVAEWVVRWQGVSSLYRAALDGSTAPQKQDLGTAAVLHAPSSSSSMTVLAVRQTATSAPALVAIPR